MKLIVVATTRMAVIEVRRRTTMTGDDADV